MDVSVKKQKTNMAKSPAVASLELIDIYREMQELEERYLVLEKRREEIIFNSSQKSSYLC